MQQRRQQYQSEQFFTANEIADFEHCPLMWWYEQFEPAVHEDTESLFVRLVELEQEHETLAPSIPEYQLIEQLLMRRGAFEPEAQESDETAPEYEMELEKMPEERVSTTPRVFSRRLLFILIAMGLTGILLMVGAVVLR